MPAPASSIVHENTVVVRIKHPGAQVSRKRWVHYHGLHGSLLELPLHVALRLVEEGAAKLPAGMSSRHLRQACDMLATPDEVPPFPACPPPPTTTPATDCAS